jgi:hypothetical protein
MPRNRPIIRPSSLRPLAALVVLLGLLGAQAGHAADLTKKEPYLLYAGNPAQMQVLWQLTATDTARIAWGTDTTCALGSVQTVEYGADHQHTYTISGLTPATRYYYRVTNEGVPHRGSFLSAPAASATQLKFLAYGDTRTYPATHNTVAGNMLTALAADPDYQTFSLFMGDFVTTGTSETSWTSEFFFSPASVPDYPNIRSLMAKLPLQACMGNHEGTGTLFTKYFPYPFAAGRYYSFDYGPVHVTVIDQYTTYTAGSPQLQWITNDLATSTKPWKFVLMHEPGWSAAGGHLNNTTVQTVLQPLFLQYGVSIVFAGHNHYYARAKVSGIQHVTTGGGGAPLGVPDWFQPNIVTCTGAYHFCQIAIDGNLLSFRATSTAGVVIDTFTIRKAVPDTTPPVVALTSPDGGETWKAGSTHPITWTATDDRGVSAVDLKYSTDGGTTFPNSIATGLANTGTYSWVVPDAPGSATRVRATARDSAGNTAADSSGAAFTIDRWTITASVGPGGSIVPGGVVPVVEGASQVFAIRPDLGYQVATLTADGAPVTPDTTWTFTGVTADHTLGATFADAAAPTVHVTSPVGGEVWDKGSTHTITWTASDNTGVDSVGVDYSRSGPAGPWLPIAHGLANSGSLPWTLPDLPTDSALVRVTAFDHQSNAGSDASDSLFRIVDPDAGVEDGGPAQLFLYRPQPDPSAGATLLRFSLPAAGRVRLEVMDLAGRRLWRSEGDLPAGTHAWRWDGDTDQGGNAGTGLYFVRLSTPWGTRTERLVRLR